MFKKPHDDYEWSNYNKIYAQQTADMQREGSSFLLKNSELGSDRIIKWKDNAHQNWKQLYQTVVDLNVTEVFECGCGPGYHLRNIKHLCPYVDTYGIELLQSQLDFGLNTLGVAPATFDTIDIADFSVPCASCLLNNKFQFVYTQAVTMHLEHTKAVEFIRNMANISSQYVFLMENWNNHDYPALLEESGVLNVFSFEMVAGSHQTYLLLTK